jgi:hypothetical protein
MSLYVQLQACTDVGRVEGENYYIEYIHFFSMHSVKHKLFLIFLFCFHLKMLKMALVCKKLLGYMFIRNMYIMSTCIKQICGYATFSRMSGTNKKKLNFSSEVTGSFRQNNCDLESHDQASLSEGCKKAAAILKETDRQMS